MIPGYGIGDFIEDSAPLFEGCLNWAGNKQNDKYSLFKSRALTDYVKRYKNGLSPTFTSNNIECYLNRCRYLIYQEKRTTTTIAMQTDKNRIKEIETDTAEKFSYKTVTFFFELSGLDFSFLRFLPIDEHSPESITDFRNMQERCLDNLFTVTVYYLSTFQNEANYITISELKSLWGLLYRYYRFNLWKKVNRFLPESLKFLMNDELSNQVYLLKSVYDDMRKRIILYKGWFDNSFDYLMDEGNSTPDLKEKYEEEYKKEQGRIKKLLNRILYICNAKGFHEIEQYSKQFISEKELSDYKAAVNDPSKSVYWKHYLIEKIIEKYYQNQQSFFWNAVLYLKNFDKAIQEYLPICQTMWNIVSSFFKSNSKDDRTSNNFRAVDCMIKGKTTYHLICELDSALCFLYFYRSFSENE